MLLRNKFPFIFGFWHFVFSQFFLASFPLVFQLALGEPQRSCSRTVTDTVGTKCQLACQCRPYPPLPPPPPPPPPPRIMFTVPPPVEPTRKPWWNEMLLVLWTGSCASVIFLLLTAIVCYKAIKSTQDMGFPRDTTLWPCYGGGPRKMEKETTTEGGKWYKPGEYAMSSRTKTTMVETNSTGV